MKKMSYPVEPMLVIRTCIKAICCKSSAAAILLSVLLYWYDRSEDECENGLFTVYRTQEQLVIDACEEITARTLHDVAAPVLQALGYIQISQTSAGKVLYSVYVNQVNAALEAYKSGTLNQFIKAILDAELEKFRIQIDFEELEKFPIELEKFRYQLEKILIPIRKISNSKRGRKPASQEAQEGKGQAPENNEITKRIDKREGKASAKRSDLPSQSVKSSSSKKPQLTDMPTLFSSKDKSVALTEDEQRVYELWCNITLTLKNGEKRRLYAEGYKPEVKQSMKEPFKKLAPLIQTQEEMDSLYSFVRNLPYLNGKAIYPGNLINTYPAWKSTQIDKPSQNGHKPAQPVDKSQKVLWTRRPETLDEPGDIASRYYDFEMMTLEEAEKYGYEELSKSLQQKIKARLEQAVA